MGRDESGKQVRGRIQAASRRLAVEALRKEGVIPTSLSEIVAVRPSTTPGFGSVSVARLAVYTRKFAQLIKTDIPLSEVFDILAEEEEGVLLPEASEYVARQIGQGTPLGEAMGARPRVFSRLYIKMVEAGLFSGTLDKVAGHLAKLYEAENVLRKKLLSKLTYPFILLAVCFLAALLLKAIGFIPPALFNGLMAFWLIIAGLGLFGMTRPGYKIYREIGLRLPAIGRLMRKINLARFCRVFGLQYAAGVPLLEGLDTSREVLQDSSLQRAVTSIQKRINAGMELRDAMIHTGVFPRRMVSMIGVGERGGGVEKMLEKMAEYYELEIDTESTILTTILYFVVYLAVAITVGVVVLSFWRSYFGMIEGLMEW